LTLPQVGSWLPPAAVIRQCEKTRKPHSTERWLSDGATCLPGSNDSCPQSQCILRTYALNALVHRKRYTQGSRQNRCVSSQDALALRARVSGTGEASGPITQPSLSAVSSSELAIFPIRRLPSLPGCQWETGLTLPQVGR